MSGVIRNMAAIGALEASGGGGGGGSDTVLVVPSTFDADNYYYTPIAAYTWQDLKNDILGKKVVHFVTDEADRYVVIAVTGCVVFDAYEEVGFIQPYVSMVTNTVPYADLATQVTFPG